MEPADLSRIQEGIEKILKEMVPYDGYKGETCGGVVKAAYILGFKSAIVEVQKLLLKE